MQTSRHTRCTSPAATAVLCVAATAALLLHHTCVPANALNANIRVGLTSSIGKRSSLIVSSKGAFEITDAASGKRISTIEAAEVKFSAKGAAVEVAVEGAPKGSYKGPIRLTPLGTDTAFEIISPKAKYTRYGHVLEITGGSSLTAVNELPLEDYVRGVAPAEVPKSFHREAQKALVVAIRTYALRSLRRHESSGYNLCDGIHCQGFTGVAREYSWADRLVDETRGQLVLYKNEPIYAVYSADCGGVTQNNEDAGFGDEPWPYLRSVADNPGGQSSGPRNPRSPARNPESEDYCAGSPWHTWSLTYTREELARKLSSSASTTAAIGKFESMKFTDYDCSGRVKTILLKGSSGETRISGRRFRQLLGLSVVKSTRMKLTAPSDGKSVIEGKGYGHGVGLCAHGANGLAKSREGITYTDILKHYYTGVEIKTIGE